MAYLLSPAGTKDALVAAVESGADEVYLGLSSFNARAGAENFTVETLAPWVKYAHVRGVKIHVTMNTLLKNDELSAAVRLAREADEIGVDAFIVQDVGLAKRLSGNVRAALHASTQMTVYNIEGVRLLRDLGFSRVVLSRELPLDEIRKIAGAGIMETEVFCHGALCMSYSGACLLSYVQGNGRSGNRGTCSQPCRLKYRPLGGNFEHLMSPADLCSLEYLQDLIATGVTSLKIEGRLKSPEYVAAVTRAYKRLMVNGERLMVNGGRLPMGDAMEELQVVFSRGGFSSGHQLGKMPVSAITKEYAGRTGLYIGKSTGRGKVLDGKVKTFRLPVSLEKPLAPGDGISFYGYPDFGGIVNKVDNGSILVCGNLPENTGVLSIYKTLDAALSKDLERYKNPELNFRKVPVSCKFTVSPDGSVELSFSDRDGNVSKETITCSFDEVRALTESSVRGAVSATGNTPFFVESFECKLLKNAFVPFSELKKMRRAAIEKLAKLRE